MDASRLGCYVIDEESGKIIQKKLLIKITLGLQRFVCQWWYPLQGSFKDIYWNSWDAGWYLTKWTLDAYENYEAGLAEVKEVLENYKKRKIPFSFYATT